MKEENKMKLRGMILGIFCPNKDNLPFVDGKAFFMFYLSYKDKGTTVKIKCKGNCYKVFAGETVILDGEFKKDNNNQLAFCFNSLLVDFSTSMTSEGLYKEILGRKHYASIAKEYGVKEKNKENLGAFIMDINSALINKNYEFFKRLKCSKKDTEEFFLKYDAVSKNSESLKVLYDYGFDEKSVKKLFDKNKNYDVNEIIKKIEINPYFLMHDYDFTFRNCDYIYKKTGKSNSKNRVTAAIYEALNNAYIVEGNCFLDYRELVEKTYTTLDTNYFNDVNLIDTKLITSLIEELILKGEIVNEEGSLYLLENYKETMNLRRFCIRAKSAKKGRIDPKEYILKYQKEHNITLGREQKIAIENSLNYPISVITGGAGVGKTSSLACLICFLVDEAHINPDRILLGAPTGKAAQRMQASFLAQTGIKMTSNTLHGMLKVKPEDTRLETFEYNATNKLDADVIVIDETSMLTYRIANALIEAVNDGTKLIFLGDVQQLEPVGAGFFFKDLIDSGVPTTYLKEVHRQKGDSTIIPLSQAVRDETLVPDNIDKKADFLFIEANKATLKAKLEAVYKVFNASIKKVGLDETMVITPLRETNGDNKMDSKTISNYIQERILPDKKGETIVERNGYKFKVGSKVIMTRNNNKKGLVNGEIGYITEFDTGEGKTKVDFNGEEKELDSSDLSDLRLGYAITVHKSQGTDWKNVIYCCFSDTTMNKKNLVYTAVTRAKTNLVIIGDKKTFLASDKLKAKSKNSKLLN